jgi:hypothetical protein
MRIFSLGTFYEIFGKIHSDDVFESLFIERCRCPASSTSEIENPDIFSELQELKDRFFRWHESFFCCIYGN